MNEDIIVDTINFFFQIWGKKRGEIVKIIAIDGQVQMLDGFIVFRGEKPMFIGGADDRHVHGF